MQNELAKDEVSVKDVVVTTAVSTATVMVVAAVIRIAGQTVKETRRQLAARKQNRK